MGFVAVIKQQVGRRRLGGEGLWDPQEMRAEEDRRDIWCSIAEIRMRWGIGFG